MERMARTKRPVEQISSVYIPRSSLLQRTCTCGGSPGADGQCEECRSKRLSLQRSTLNSAWPFQVPPLVYDVLHSPGQPLDTATRAVMEPHFRYDFSKVRVHTDKRAIDSAQSVNALAYTVGQNVVFGMGQYKPETNEGRRLLAHELTHVVQQRPHSSMPGSLGSRNTLQEREATDMSSTFSQTQSERARATTVAPLLQRQEQGFKFREPLSRPEPHITLRDRSRVGKHINAIFVNLDTPQNVRLFWDDWYPTPAIECSTGRGRCCPDPCAYPKNMVDGSNCTPTGVFKVIDKQRRTGSGLNFFVHFARKDIALHEYSPVDGTPLSHGCVRLHRSDAMTIYHGSIEGKTWVIVGGKAVPRCPVRANGDYFDPVTRKKVPVCRAPGKPPHPKTPSPKAPKAENEPSEQAGESETALSMEQESISELDPPLG